MMKKILKLLLIVGTMLYSYSFFSENMDQKVFYDADKTQNDKLAQMSSKLDKFINSDVNDSVIVQYKNAKVLLSEEEKAKLVEEANKKVAQNQVSSTKQQTQNEKPGFFARMLEKIGIGSTKRLPTQEDSSIQAEQNSTQEVSNGK